MEHGADWLENNRLVSDDRHPMDILEPQEEPELDIEEVEKLKRYDPELIALLLRILLFPNLGRSKLHSSWHRLVALGHCLHVPGIGERSLADLASEMGCSKALLSWYAVRLRDFGGLDHQAGKSVEAREIYAKAREVWLRGNKRTPARKIHARTTRADA